MKISTETARKLARELRVNLNVIPLKWWKRGIEIELEHGSELGVITNITNDDKLITAKIALAHLIEFPDYYERLDQMEKKAKVFWKNKRRPNIFL